MWSYQQTAILGDPKNISFDERVIVRAPVSAEDAFEVPVEVDATAIGDVEEIVVSVDYGPIPKILSYKPKEAAARFAFRFKIDQATPIRASVRTKDGSWYVGGTHIDASGGGCSAPAAAYAMPIGSIIWAKCVADVAANRQASGDCRSSHGYGSCRRHPGFHCRGA